MNRSSLTKAQRWEIADRLAEDRLDLINAKCKPVHKSKHVFLYKKKD